jgi:WD domain, G-beta repeat
VQARQEALKLLEEAARSDELVAQTNFQRGEDTEALAYLARAFHYLPKSLLLAETTIPGVLSSHSQTAFQGHTDEVYSAVFSPDGRRVLTASKDRTAQLWEAESGKLVATFQGHSGWVISAVFSPDGRRVLTASGIAGRCPPTGLVGGFSCLARWQANRPGWPNRDYWRRRATQARSPTSSAHE